MGRNLKHAGIVLASIAALALGGAANAAKMTPALKKLIAAAEKEGELQVMWGASSMGGPKGAKAFAQHMNKIYGINITIKWAPGPSMPRMGNRIAMRHANGLPSPSDVYMGFSRNMGTLLKHKMFQSAPWGEYAPGRLTDRIVEQNGTMLKILTALVGFTYNKKLAPSVPTRVSDFLKPEWKGKVATTPYGAGFDQLAAKEAWGADRTIAFAEKFTNQIAGFIRCSEAERLSSGEFLALIFDCSGDSMKKAIERGAPLARVVPPDVPIVSYFYFGVPKNAVHPNMAKLFITYALSEEGQRKVYEMTGGDLHLFPGSVIRKQVMGLEKKYGIKFKSADVAWQIANKSGNAAQRKAKKIMRKARKKKK